MLHNRITAADIPWVANDGQILECSHFGHRKTCINQYTPYNTNDTRVKSRANNLSDRPCMSLWQSQPTPVPYLRKPAFRKKLEFYLFGVRIIRITFWGDYRFAAMNFSVENSFVAKFILIFFI